MDCLIFLPVRTSMVLPPGLPIDLKWHTPMISVFLFLLLGHSVKFPRTLKQYLHSRERALFPDIQAARFPYIRDKQLQYSN